MKACGSLWKTVSSRFSKDLVGAFCASTDPAASTRHDGGRCQNDDELGHLVGSASRGLRTVCPTKTAIDVLTEAVRSCEIPGIQKVGV